MIKLFKYLLIVIMILIIILISLPFVIPTRNYKNIVEAKIQEYLPDRIFKINGDIDIAFFPNIILGLKDISLSAPTGFSESNLFEVKEARVILSLAQLLSRKFGVSAIELNQPQVNLEVGAGGVDSWKITIKNSSKDGIKDSQVIVSTKELGMTKESGTQSAATEHIEFQASSKSMTLPLLINTIKIINGRLQYIDNKNKETLDEINLKVSMDSKAGPLHSILDFKRLGHKYNFDIKVEALQEITSVIVKSNILNQTIKLDGIVNCLTQSFLGKINVSGNTKNIKDLLEVPVANYELEGKLNLTPLKIELNEVKLSGINNIELKGEGRYNLQDNSGYIGAMLNPGKVGIVINGTYKSPLSKANIILHSKNLTSFMKNLGIQNEQLTALNNKEMSLSTNLVYGSKEIILSNCNMHIGTTILNGNINLKNLEKNLDASYDITTTNNIELFKLLKLPLISSFNNVKAKGEVHRINNSYKIDSQFIGSNLNINIVGTADLNPGKKANIIMKVTAPLLNLDNIAMREPEQLTAGDNLSYNNELIASTKNEKDQKNKEKVSKSLNSERWSKDILDFKFLDNFDADVNFNINKLIGNKIIFDNLSGRIVISAGDLNVTSLKSDLFGGRLNASTKLQKQNMHLNFNLNEVNLKYIIPTTGKYNIVAGKLSVAGNVSAQGQTIYSYVNSLTGKVTANAANIIVGGFNLPKVISTIENTQNIQSLLNLSSNSFILGETKINSLKVSTSINNGIVHFDEGNILADNAKMNITGNIDLPKYLLNIGSSAQIKNYPAINIRTTGAIDNPNHSIDAQSLQGYLLNNVVGGMMQDIKEGKVNPRDLLNKMLKQHIADDKDKKLDKKEKNHLQQQVG